MIFTNFRYSVVYSFPHLFLKTNLKTANFNMSKNNVFTYFLIETNVRVLLSPLDICAGTFVFTGSWHIFYYSEYNCSKRD